MCFRYAGYYGAGANGVFQVFLLFTDTQALVQAMRRFRYAQVFGDRKGSFISSLRYCDTTLRDSEMRGFNGITSVKTPAIFAHPLFTLLSVSR